MFDSLANSVETGSCWSRVKRRLNLRARLRYYVRRLVPLKLRRYIAKDWLFIEPLRNYLIDLRYGGSCAGAIPTQFREMGAHGTSSSDYRQLDLLFRDPQGIPVRPSDVLVDVGCGKGRVINYWLRRGFRNRMVGIELDERFAQFAAERLKAFPNVEIRCGDAVELLPAEGTIYYLFNPFNGAVMERFRDRLNDRLGDRTDVLIIYQYCSFVEVFEQDPRWTVEPVRTGTFYPSAIIRRKVPDRTSRSS